MDRPVLLLLGLDRQTRNQSRDCETDKPRPLHPRLAAVNGKRRGDGSGEHPQERNTLHTAHTGRNAILAADVPHQRILRRRVQRALKSHQQDRRDDKCRGLKRKPRDADTDNRDLRPLRQLEDPPLGEDNRQPVRERRTKDERQHQRPRRDAHEDGPERRIGNPSDDNEARQRLQKVIVERSEQVRHEQRSKAPPPSCCRTRVVFHRLSPSI